ncbi:MAG: 3-deoxy-7-phosphoheptulonate synthase [Planctomycetota bacterium]|jgi:3-deoxy-7-phosphoheptulonate synthase
MKILMKRGAGLRDVGRVLSAAEEDGLSPRIVRKDDRVTVCVPDGDSAGFRDRVGGLACVEAIRSFKTGFKLVSREFRTEDTVVHAGGVPIGGRETVLMAGPCAVESRDQIFRAAEAVRLLGGHILRGGAFKPRTSPYAFRGLGEEGLDLLAQARERFCMPVVTEVLNEGDVELVASYADLLQVGSRNMQNFTLLEAMGSARKPVLLKRGMMSTMKELLQAAEYVVAGGNPDVILCERGIRTFESSTRNTLDINAVAVLKDLSHLPVIVDPSHATGKRRYVLPAALAGMAAGADGLIVEVHPRPEEALCDGDQSLTPDGFSELVVRAGAVARAVDRDLLERP